VGWDERRVVAVVQVCEHKATRRLRHTEKRQPPLN
jgi:hypothetical protein